MAALFGMLIGSLIATYLLASLWQWALFKRVLDDPLKGTLASVGAAWLTGSAIGGWGMADGGSFYWSAFPLYAPAALILAALALWRGQSLRAKQP